MLRYYNKQVVFQEVPNEVSISYSIAGCPLNCKGCSWKNTIANMQSKELTDSVYIGNLKQYQNLASCVLFFGGEWNKQELIHKLQLAKTMGYKTCLYTGLTMERVDKDILDCLNYIKVGPYIESLGGLACKTTNQRLINLDTNEIMNHYLVREAI